MIGVSMRVTPFLFLVLADTPSDDPITVIVNWTAELGN